jgi:diamine N-acetyltransferase
LPILILKNTKILLNLVETIDNFTQIQALTSADAEALSHLCLKIYPQFFPYLWHDGGAWYQQKAYNPTQLRQEIESPHSKFYFVIDQAAPVGYLKLNTNTFLKDYPSRNGLEVERIYLLQQTQGKGFGKLLINFAASQAQLLQKDHLFLYVMESSTDSINFYKAMGFSTFGRKSLDFPLMKEALRGMYAMVRPLELNANQ